MWRSRRKAWVVGLVTAILLLLPGVLPRFSGVQAGEWEMRVCADPDYLPFSNKAEEGFENKIAEILADQLNADLTYEWMTKGARTVRYGLQLGACDIVLGVPDGYADLLTTVTYYRSTYVFVYKSDSPFEIEAFDDPELANLRIGLPLAGIPPHRALIDDPELSDNVVLLSPYREYGKPSPVAVQAIIDGEVDVAIDFGPAAAYFANQQSVDLDIVPVSPEIMPPFLPMTYATTIGMRPSDKALRDRLNIALAKRWDDIQEVLREYDVPLKPVTKPIVSTATP